MLTTTPGHKRDQARSWIRSISDYTFGNTDMRVSDVKPISLDVVQTLRSVDSRSRFPVPVQLYRLKWIPGCKPGGQVVPTCDSCDAKHPSRAPKNMYEHLPKASIAASVIQGVVFSGIGGIDAASLGRLADLNEWAG